MDVAVSDDLENIKFPNRDATFLRNGFVLSQLDGEGMRQMEKQQEMASKESYKEHLLKEIAKNTGANIHDLRNDSHQEMRTDRVEKAVHFDISQDDDVTMTASSEVQAEAQSTGVQAKAQTTSSGSQSSTTKMDQFGGTQTPRIKMKDRGSQSQATEDRTEEIEQLRQASELEKQALIQQHEQNIERVRQQVTDQVMAQAEAEHSKKQEGYKQEFIQRTQITEAEAQRQINKAQHQAQQEAQQYVGSVFQYAQQTHREQQRAKREQMNQMRKEKEQAELEKERAEKRAKRAERAEHNTEYKATPSTPDNRAKPKKTRTGASRSDHNTEHNTDHKNEQTPDNRPKAKAKTGPSPNRNQNLPPFPTGEKASGSQDNPESTHEPKGKAGRPTNTQAKAKVQKDIFKEKPKTQAKPNPRKNPKHDTEVDNNTDFKYWQGKNLTVIKDQLNKRGYRKHKTPDGRRMKKADYLEELRKMLDENTWLMMG